MATYRNTNPEGDLLEKVKRYIGGLGLYTKPAAGIPASDLAKWVLPSAVTYYSVGGLGYTKNLGPNLGTGVVIGTTEQVRLSQLVAIKAFKEGEYFVNANLTEYIT